MEKPKVYLTRHIKLFEELALSYPEFDLEMASEGEINPFKRSLNQYQGIISTLSDPINDQLLNLTTSLKVISNFAVGYNNIDLKAAKKRNIRVGNTPDTLTHSTAELALTLLLMGSRRTTHLQTKVKEGGWKNWEPEIDNGHDFRNKTLGIIGFGRIGQAFGEMAYNLWKTEILIWPRKSAETVKTSFPFKVVTKNDFFEKVDILSLHCPLNSETENLINEDFIHSIKRNFHFVNTARGGCHNEADLLKAIESGKILSCGLDVTNPEPIDSNSPLLKNLKVSILPHIGSATDRTRREMAIQCLDNIKAGLKGESLPFQVC